jgi:hypothetical protein
MITPDALPDETDIPTQKLKDNGRSGSSGDVPAYDPSERDLGYILDEEDEEKVAKHVHELRDDQKTFMSYNTATWKRNGWWRDGKRWVRLEKVENQQLWEAKLPKGMANAPPVPNKTDRLCRRIVNVIYVDPPYPDCEPGDDSPEAREAAETATEYLSVLGSPSSLNMEAIGRAALDKAMGFASSFGWVIMDPQGAGHRPRSMLAHPEADHQDNALLDGNGFPADKAKLTERYIRSDGFLTDNPNEADFQWLSRPKVRLLGGNKVYFLPSTATGMKDAEGVLITDHTTLGELRSLFPEIDDLDEEAMQDICSWKPDKYKDLLPPFSPEIKDQKEQREDGSTYWKDSQVVFTITVYYRSTGSYPMGCYAIVAGKKQVLHRKKWTGMMQQPPAEDGTDRPPVETPLRIPLAQQRALDDNTNDNPYGVAPASHLGPADEIRASSLGYQLEYMFRFGNPIPMFPMGTIVQPKQWQLRDGNPIYFNPARASPRSRTCRSCRPSSRSCARRWARKWTTSPACSRPARASRAPSPLRRPCAHRGAGGPEGDIEHQGQPRVLLHRPERHHPRAVPRLLHRADHALLHREGRRVQGEGVEPHRLPEHEGGVDPPRLVHDAHPDRQAGTGERHARQQGHR